MKLLSKILLALDNAFKPIILIFMQILAASVRWDIRVIWMTG